jgi:NAD/NADP transhydrogenase beta subunit
MSQSLANMAYLSAAILFILSLGALSNPETSRRGNLFGMIGMALAVLATVVCITPGTAWAELSLDRSVLMLHVLELDDAAAAAAKVKERYERPLMEIFE